MYHPALKMVNVKYSEKNIPILENIFLTIPPNESLGVVCNSKTEIIALKKILTSTNTNYGGYIFLYEDLLRKKQTKIKKKKQLTNQVFDVLDFTSFNEKYIIDLLSKQIVNTMEFNKLTDQIKQNWEKVFLSGDKETLDQEIEVYLKLIQEQKKVIQMFSKKWSKTIKEITDSFQLKKYKEILNFLENYEKERKALYETITKNFIEAQNNIFQIYLNFKHDKKVVSKITNVEKISDLLADGNAEIIHDIQQEVDVLKSTIEQLTKSLELLKSENKTLWTTVFHDLDHEIDEYRKKLRSNEENEIKLIFWFKKVILLKNQFDRLKKEKNKIDKLNSDQFIDMLQKYELFNDRILADSFPVLDLSGKSKKAIISDLKNRVNFSFYTYELLSEENDKLTIKKISELEKIKKELEKKLANKSLYNEKQIKRQKEEESLINSQIIADQKWDSQIRKTELTTIVFNIQNDKQTLINAYNSVCNWLFKTDKKIMSIINKMDRVFTFFSKKDHRKIKSQMYRENFKQYFEQDLYFSHLKNVNHYFENPYFENNLKLGLVLYNLYPTFNEFGLEMNIFWKKYKFLKQEDKLKINLVLSKLLKNFIFILDFDNSLISEQDKKLCWDFFNNKSAIIFDEINKFKEFKTNNMALIKNGYVIEQGSRNNFFNNTVHPYLKEFLKTGKWNVNKINELNELEFMSFNSRKIYLEAKPSHWVFGSATFLDLTKKELNENIQNKEEEN